ncbi:MAG: hypothetical protein K2Y18_02080 [Alphaproteobacteria bacterium]|jgi:hypothetical protein|nr:hypothetical protein [Alphaproteobacteria bacterium]
MRILGITLILAFLAPSIFAHAGHDHEKETAQVAKPSPSAEHPSASGRMFEVVMERCEADKVDLYISDSQTNEPIADAQVEVLATGDTSLTSKAAATKSPGVYLLILKANDGNKVTLELKVSTPKMSESLTLTVPQWPKASGKCAP